MGLRDPQHEKLATLIGSGTPPEEAWLEAFGKPVDADQLEWLLGDPDIKGRIRETQDTVLAGTVCDRVWLLDKLREAIEQSLDAGKAATAIRGIELAGKLPELRLFPSETRVHHTKDPFTGMSDEEIRAEAKRIGLLRPDPKVIEATATPIEEEDGEPATVN